MEKKIYYHIKNIIFILMLTTTSNTIARLTSVNIHIIDSLPSSSVTLIDLSEDLGNATNKFINSSVELNLIHNKALWENNLQNAKFVQLWYRYDNKSKWFSYMFYLTPGDSLTFTVNFLETSKIIVSGKGSSNNQPTTSLIYQDILSFNETDTLPSQFFIKQDSIAKEQSNVLNNYFKHQQTSSTFEKAFKMNQSFRKPLQFIEYESAYLFHNRASFLRNRLEWARAEDSLLHSTEINDTNALQLPNYRSFLMTFLLRKKEFLWIEENVARTKFYNQWYPGSNMDIAVDSFKSDKTNILTKKIIDQYFCGDAKELAYKFLLTRSVEQGNIFNIPNIYNEYKRSFPSSNIIDLFDKWIYQYDQSLENPNNRIVTIQNSANTFSNLDSIANFFKAEKKLIYIWGTWCGPCLEELSEYFPKIRDSIDSKSIIYIAINDENKYEKWKDYIYYQKMQGYNILANNELWKDINHRLKVSYASTFLILRKDGTFYIPNIGKDPSTRWKNTIKEFNRN